MAFAGSNHHFFTDLTQAKVDIGASAVSLNPTGERVYDNDGTYPNAVFSWPSLPASNPRVCISIRPPLWELINPLQYPALASELKHFLTAAPAGAPSLIALWHEASGDNWSCSNKTPKADCGPNKNLVCRGPGGIYSAYFASLDSQFPNQGGAAGLLTQAQVFVQKKARKLNANVLVGAIEVVSKATSSDLACTISPWMADDLDFYACDVYDSSTGTAVPADLLGVFQTVAQDHMKTGSPVIGITETNSRFPGRRPFWFASAWSWLKSNGYTSSKACCFLTYWNDVGIESGNWISDDWATIDVLQGIFADAASS